MSEAQKQGPSPEESVTALGAELLQLNLSAYQLGHHGLAHHLLSAALHCAQGSGDDELVQGVWRRAEDQRRELERSPGADGGPRDRILAHSLAMLESVAAVAASVSQRLKLLRAPAPGKSLPRQVGQIDPLLHPTPTK